MKQYFEFKDEKSNKFWEIELTETIIKTRYGKIGADGQSTEKSFANEATAQKEYDKLVKEKMGKGYVAVGVTDETVSKKNASAPKQISWEEFEEKYLPNFKQLNESGDIADYVDSNDDYIIYLYEPDNEGNVIIEGDFEIEDEKNAVILGNLIVKGNVSVSNDYGNFLAVDGHLQAHNLFLQDCAFLNINGNLTVKNGIVGQYGDNGGALMVDGETSASVIINDTYFNMNFEGDISAIVIDTTGSLEADYTEDDLHEALLPKFLEDDHLDTNKIIDCLKSGKSPLKKALVKVEAENSINTIIDKTVTENSVKPETMTLTAAAILFAQLAEQLSHYSGDVSVEVYRGDLFYHGDLIMDGSGGIIVTGNLIVTGSIINMEMDYGKFLFVLGNVKVKNIDKAGSEFYFAGNCQVENVIYGFYNHGSLKVNGEVGAKYIINDDHFFEFNKISKDTVEIDSDDASDTFIAKVLKDDGESIDSEKLIEFVNNGKEILKHGIKASINKVSNLIDKLSENGKPITTLKLNGLKLNKFPNEVLKLKNLQVLDLQDNHLDTLPNEIEQLENLEELNLRHCSLKKLPENLHQLRHLRLLDLSYNTYENQLVIDENFNKLSSLKELRIDYLTIRSNPDCLRNLKLEVLYVFTETFDDALDFHLSICELTTLKKLDLSGNPFKSIPREITQLENLEELNLNASLCYLNDIPDFSKLKKLKKLSANGNTHFTSNPYPNQNLIKSFFKITSLESLSINRFGKEEKNKKVCREALQPEHLEGISNLKKLKEIDLSFNTLSALPEEFYKLTQLKTINLEYNAFGKAECQKIVKSFPAAKINLLNQKTEEEVIDNPDFKKVSDLIKKGYESQRNNEFVKALNFYDNALTYFQNGSVTDEYNLTYLHYMKMYVYSKLGYQTSSLAKDEICNYRKLTFEEANICLELIPVNHSIWQFTDEGQFQIEVVRYACNCIAWELYANNEDPEILEEALEYAKRGSEFADDPRYWYVVDTQVRILMKLKRTEEAYQIVYKILRQDPKFSDFQNFKTDPGYLKWKKQN